MSALRIKKTANPLKMVLLTNLCPLWAFLNPLVDLGNITNVYYFLASVAAILGFCSGYLSEGRAWK